MFLGIITIQSWTQTTSFHTGQHYYQYYGNTTTTTTTTVPSTPATLPPSHGKSFFRTFSQKYGAEGERYNITNNQPYSVRQVHTKYYTPQKHTRYLVYPRWYTDTCTNQRRFQDSKCTKNEDKTKTKVSFVSVSETDFVCWLENPDSIGGGRQKQATHKKKVHTDQSNGIASSSSCNSVNSRSNSSSRSR